MCLYIRNRILSNLFNSYFPVTFQTVLCFFLCYRAKGVKVELGIPDEMWDSPNAEVTQIKKMVLIAMQ